MNRSIASNHKQTGYLHNSTLILIAFSSAYFARLVDSLGAPSLVNFIHFFTVPLCFLVALLSTQTKDRQQIKISWQLMTGLTILLGVAIASAMLNDAGIINVVMHFLMLGEPFLLLIAIICTPISPENLKQFKNWIVGCAFFNMLLAFVMWPLTHADLLPRSTMGYEDSIQGVFYFSGAGNTVSTSVSMTFAFYYFANAKKAPLWFRLLLLFAAFFQLIISDSKQVIFAFLLAGILLALSTFKNVGQAIKYVLIAVLAIWAFLWCVENVPAFLAFKQWMQRAELYGPDGEVTLTKTSVFRMVPPYYHSPLNWLFGLGSGHTVSRLGGWMLKDYSGLLEPLGSTIHPVSTKVWIEVGNNPVASGSTMFLPFFGWAGIWGDLGFLGLGAYLYLGSIVWGRLCLDKCSQFLLLTVFAFGLIFTQMEEPGYMLFIATLLGLQWQERRQGRKVASSK
jgi:hypothetical protein